MCTRISVFVPTPPTSTDLEALESWSTDCGVGIERVSGAAGLWRGTSILVTRSHCDCGTPIGSMSRSGPRHNPEKAVQELRKRGWSETKIARALAQKKEAKERNDARQTTIALAGLADWVAFFKGAPAHAHLKSIGVFYREDGRWLSPADLQDARRETSALTSLDPLLLAHLRKGVLHEFSA